jgi:serine/threonine-protein kinase
MDVEEALEFADKLIYAKTGKHLNDLEREVFSGSWQGHIYEKIYPINPEYVEKDVGYKLWKKLSKALGEKVTKKNVRGALERSLKRQPLQLEEVPRLQPPALPLDKAVVVGKRVFISHRAQEPDFSLAVQLYEAPASSRARVAQWSSSSCICFLCGASS